KVWIESPAAERYPFSPNANSSVRIRPATVTDADAIARLATELGYPASGAEIRTRLTTLLGSRAHFIAVAEREGEVIGWVGAEHRTLLESGERAELVGLVVSVGARRSGIGSALVGSAEAWAQGRGLTKMGVRSNIGRAEAHPFYEHLGYARTKTQHAYAKALASV
ncbi:MAG TPA: GNAT family N-acetyltransferase, partial [Opitutaceae bacterium]